MPPRSAPKGRPRAYLFWGQEELRKKEAVQLLIEELVPPEDRELDVQYIDATNSGVSGEALLNAVRDRAMFSEQRVVVVLNAGRLRGPKHQRTQEVLAAGIPTLPEYSTLVLVANAEDADERRGKSPFGEKLMAALKSSGMVKQFAQMKPEELAELASREAAAAGKNLSPPAAAMLAERAGPDSQRVLQEIRKLIAYVGEGKAIAPKDVAEMVSAPPDDNIFHLLTATMDGNRPQALSVLRHLRESGMAVPQILVMLARTLRQVTQAKFLQDRGVQPTAAAEDVAPDVLASLPEDSNLFKSTKDWQRKQLWTQARRITWPHLQRALDRLAVVDAGMKGWDQGVEDPDLAIELFVVSLCDTIRPSAPQQPSFSGGRGRSR